MIKNYFKLAWRNLLKHKTDSLINIVGLCVAFTCALLLFLSVYFEFSFDRFHKHAHSIYHLYFLTNTPNETEAGTAMPVPLAPSLKETYPEIKYAARSISTSTVIRYKDKKLSENLKLTDPDFLRMFSFPFETGNAATALSQLNNVVLRDKSAKAIFGNEDPVGKTIEIQVEGEWQPFTVSGILSDFPDNSSISYDAIIRFEHQSDYQSNTTQWNNFNHDVYVQLQDNASASSLEKRTASFVAKNFAEGIEDLKRDGAIPFKDSSYMQLHFQPLLDMHTNTKISGEGGSINSSYLYLLLTIGCLILIIACINFINLGIGRSFTRTHEIGLRKTLGAQKFQLIWQFWSEAFLICLVALAMSCALTYWLLPKYRVLFAMNIREDILGSPLIWLAVFCVFFIITLVAGGYPAWVMARFNIIQILKGKISIKRSHKLRNSLIVVQFSITILLMICTIVAWQQINFLRAKPLGYNKTQVISIPVKGDVNPVSALELMRTKLAAHPNVESVSGIYDNLGRGKDGSSRRSILGFDYKNRGVSTVWMGVSYDFAKTLELKFVAGRDFSKQFANDSNAVIINEEMAQELGEKNPVGLAVPFREDEAPKQIIGVVKNFNFESLHGKIKPLTLVLESRFPPNYVLVKVKPHDLAASMDLVRQTWKQVAPNDEYKGSFLDENVDRQYRREEKLGKIFIYGAVTAIILSCMGLLAMVILIIAQRTKEIGIRKVLGASATSIVGIVSKDFVLLVLVSFVIAAPLAWIFMNKWLQDFAYRINIQWWMFAVAAASAVAIAFVTICLQALRAAFMNPVKTLRTE
jgi:ABC-type antimicrobial peptide transport system permease subunit